VKPTTTTLHAEPVAWLGLAYVSVVSMFLGFFAWYAGLARGGVARVGQVQLLQPLLTFLWAGLVLGEHVGAGTVLAATGVLASVVVTQRARVRQPTLGGRVPATTPPPSEGRDRPDLVTFLVAETRNVRHPAAAGGTRSAVPGRAGAPGPRP